MSEKERENLTVDGLIDSDVLAEVSDAMLGPDLTEVSDDDFEIIGEGDTGDMVVTGVTSEPAPAAPAAAAAPTGPAIEVSDELGPDEPGQVELGRFSALKVLFGCALSRSNGIARFKNGEGTLRLHYMAGVVVEAISTVPDFALGPWLVERGALDNESLQAAMAARPQNDNDFKRAIVAVTGMAEPLLGAHVTEWSRAVLAHLATRADGTCHFQEGPPRAPLIALGFDRFRSLDQAIASGFSEELLMERLSRISSRSLLPRKIGETGFEDLDIDEQEREVIASLDDTKSLDDLIAEAGDDLERKMATLRAVYLGLESELLRLGHGPAGRAQLQKAKEFERALNQLKAKKNYFDVLGIGPDTSDQDVRARYMEMKRRVTADASDKELPELADARKRLADLIENAYKALATREKRDKGKAAIARIRPNSRSTSQSKGTPSGAAAAAAAAKTSLAPAPKMASSIELFQDAEAAARKGNYELSVQKIEEAIETRPDKVGYRMYLEYYKVLSDRYDRRGSAETAIKEIEQMLNEDEPLVDAHIIMGRLFKFARRKKDAVYEFEKALELDPDNQEAQTEVRIATNAPRVQGKAPSRAQSAISFLKKKLGQEEEQTKKKKRRKKLSE